jgi:hypothetical protein
MSLTELALLDGRRPLPLGDVIGLTFNYIFTFLQVITTNNYDTPADSHTIGHSTLNLLKSAFTSLHCPFLGNGISTVSP